ncbi:MAG: YerC/YecD family TrpR-related protein [Bacillota bacterium]
MGRQLDGLIEAVLMLRNKDEARRFLDDLCTTTELKTLAQRWEAARMLDDGLTYEAIEGKTSMSSATISRIKRAMTEGSGYTLLLGRLKRRARDR